MRPLTDMLAFGYDSTTSIHTEEIPAQKKTSCKIVKKQVMLCTSKELLTVRNAWWIHSHKAGLGCFLFLPWSSQPYLGERKKIKSTWKTLD